MAEVEYLRDDLKTDRQMGEPKEQANERTRLFRAVETANRLLRPYRDAVVEMNREYTGPLYGLDYQRANHSYRANKYVNMLKQAVSAYVTLLASQRPRVLLTTPAIELRPFAKHFELALNKLFEDIQLEETLRTWVRDAFFWVGTLKVHMADTNQLVQEGDLLMDPGKPFVSNISLDNFFWDTNANKWSECRFMGDMYRLPVDYVKNSGLYEGEALEYVQPTSKRGNTETRLEDISMGYETDDDELEPMTDVCDIWLPRKGVVQTYIVSNKTNIQLNGPPIGEFEWEGRENGPYKVLHFDEVSENVMPCSTAADLYPLDKLINNIFTKQARKAKRAKRNPAYTPAGADAARKIKNASDGDWVEVQDAREINVVDSGGVDPGLQGFMLNSIESFDRMAGNLQAMMGLGAQTETVGQEKLVHGAASRREGELQNAVLKATTKLARDLAFLLWIDEHTVLPNRMEVDGIPGASVDATWIPRDREGEFDDYNFAIDVYSMAYQGPGERVAKIQNLLQQIYLPLMPFVQQQGGTIDLAALTDLYAEMLDIPRLKDICVFAQPIAEPAAGQNPMKSPVTNRNYTRRNVSDGGTGMTADQWLQQAERPQS